MELREERDRHGVGQGGVNCNVHAGVAKAPKADQFRVLYAKLPRRRGAKLKENLEPAFWGLCTE